MKYILSKETQEYRIYDFSSITIKENYDSSLQGPWVDFRATEWQSEGYHWLRSEVTNLSQDPDYLSFVRDYKIFQIESTSELDSVGTEFLRVQSHLNKNQSKTIWKSDLERQEKLNFKPGDPIYYNSEPGIITYKHRGEEVKFTIRVKDTYVKYVPYYCLSKRIKKDYSHIKVSPEIKKLSTKELLATRSYHGQLSDMVKAELQTREHVKRKTKVKEYGK